MKPTIPITENQLRSRLINAHLWSGQVQTALNQTVASHAMQLTKDGASYLEDHLFPVVYDLLEYNNGSMNEAIVTISLLHDVLEDDPTMNASILSTQFPDSIVKSIEVLTRQSEYKGASEQDKLRLSGVYMQNIMKADYNTRIVKLADRIVNLELVERLRTSNPGKFKRYLQETKELFIPLAQLTSPLYLDRISKRLEQLTSS